MSFHLKEAHRECGWLVVPARILRRMRSRTDGGNRKRAGKKRKKKKKEGRETNPVASACPFSTTAQSVRGRTQRRAYTCTAGLAHS